MNCIFYTAHITSDTLFSRKRHEPYNMNHLLKFGGSLLTENVKENIYVHLP